MRDAVSREVTAPSGATLYLEQADQLEYFERERRVELTGHVRVRFETNTVQADVVHVDLERETIAAEGHLVWDGDDLHASGSRMTYSLKDKTGTVEDVLLTTGAWLCRGERVEQSGENTVRVTPGVLTTCTAPRPHYSIRCRSIRIRLGQDLVARSVTVLVGTTPVFWLPVLATPLREFRLPFEAQVGRTRDLGAFVRTSPAYSFVQGAPGQAHVDYFQRTGWGVGLTQDVLATNRERPLRAHGYWIREHAPSQPGVSRERWETYAVGSRPLWPGAQAAGAADFVSDPHERAQYGFPQLSLPATPGERRAHVLLSQELTGVSLGLLMERVETLHLTPTPTGGAAFTERYALSTIHAPQGFVQSRPWTPLPWLGFSARGTADRFFSWQNGWYVNSVSLTPSAELFGRVPLLGAVDVVPRLSGVWRDRGDRTILAGTSATAFIEDANRGLAWRGESAVSLRRGLAPGLDLELTHAYGRRLNKVGYDPYGYHGVDRHRVGTSLTERFGEAGRASVLGGYDLRDRQDPRRRRWSPVTPQLSLVPLARTEISAEGQYDVWYGRWRGVSGSIAAGDETAGPWVRLRPRFANNRLALPVAEQTAQEYRIAHVLYGASFQDSTVSPSIFTVDADLVLSVTSLLRVTGTGQWDVPARRVPWYTVSVTRNLHCWELVGTFQRYPSGEVRFNLAIALVAFPQERVPLLGL